MPKLPEISTDNALGALVLFAGGFLAVVAEGLRETFSGSDFTPLRDITGWGWPFLAVALFGCFRVARIEGANGTAVRIAIGSFMLALAGTLTQAHATPGLILALASVGTIVMFRGVILYFRGRIDIAPGPHEGGLTVIAAIWVGATMFLLDPEAALYIAAFGVLAARGLPAMSEFSARFDAWLARVTKRTAPAPVAPAEADDPGPKFASADAKVIAKIVRFLSANFPRDAEDMFCLRVQKAPAFNTYFFATNAQFNFAKVQTRLDSLSSFLGLDENTVNVVPTGLMREDDDPDGGIMVQVAREFDDRDVVWYDALLKRSGHLVADRPYAAVVGVDMFGRPVVVDLDDPVAPHLLVSGGTASGKTSVTSAIFTQLLDKNSPKDFRMIYIDPKGVDGRQFEDLPHLLFPVALGPDQVLPAIKKAREVLNARMGTFPKGINDIQTFRRVHPDVLMPSVVIYIDEAAAVGGSAMADKKVKEAYDKDIQIIATQGRSYGVWLVLALQRPSSENLSMAVRSQMNQRLTFRLAAPTESVMVLDDNRALSLGGRGDGYYTLAGRPASRFAGAYLPGSVDPRHPGATVLSELDRITTKYGGPNNFDRAGLEAAKARGETLTAEVSAEHTGKIENREWFMVRGWLDTIDARLPEYVAEYEARRDAAQAQNLRADPAINNPHDARMPLAGSDIVEAATARVPSGYPMADPLTGSEIDEMVRAKFKLPFTKGKFALSRNALHDEVRGYAAHGFDPDAASLPVGPEAGIGAEDPAPVDVSALFQQVADATEK